MRNNGALQTLWLQNKVKIGFLLLFHVKQCCFICPIAAKQDKIGFLLLFHGKQCRFLGGHEAERQDVMLLVSVFFMRNNASQRQTGL